MTPQLVRSLVVHFDTCLPLAISHTRISPIKFPAATCLPSGVKATACVGGTWPNCCRNSPVRASKIFTEGSCSGPGSYLYPPASYRPVTEATRDPSADTSMFHDQKSCAFTLRTVLRS